MLIGIDDTDSPAGMCTTYLGARLARELSSSGMSVREARLIRLNPNVTWKTRGNAAICLDVGGDPDAAFEHACRLVEELADFSCGNTNPGVVVADDSPDPAFYRKAVTDFCTIDEAVQVLERAGARYRGYKNRRGLIGATAAVSCDLPDRTFELLAYRHTERWGAPRDVDRESFFAAEKATFPHTWDTVDWENRLVVCIPHTPDPVLFGIRGESPEWIGKARAILRSEDTALELVWVTNQGTDAHLLEGTMGDLKEGLSYRVRGTVASFPVTGPGGHVSVTIADKDQELRCMAYEPTKGFRELVRILAPGDQVTAVGSYKNGSLNLEKVQVISVASLMQVRPPVCLACEKRMTSNGKGKGYKCKKCGARSPQPETEPVPRTLEPGWYEVPPTARRHLAKPLVRFGRTSP
ncbi:MAG: tRNA(Ile)(2)-agmatinylcytidine synthase [Methanoregulaceae archaeon]